MNEPAGCGDGRVIFFKNIISQICFCKKNIWYKADVSCILAGAWNRTSEPERASPVITTTCFLVA